MPDREGEGFDLEPCHYLAVVLNGFSRWSVGEVVASHLRAERVVNALDLAIAHGPSRVGVMHHLDHGSQYTRLTFGQRSRDAGILALRGSRGDCYDNALVESFFAPLGCELLDREGFSNPHQRHSALSYCSPIEHERRWTTRAQEVAQHGTGHKSGVNLTPDSLSLWS